MVLSQMKEMTNLQILTLAQNLAMLLLQFLIQSFNLQLDLNLQSFLNQKLTLALFLALKFVADLQQLLVSPLAMALLFTLDFVLTQLQDSSEKLFVPQFQV